MCACKEIGRHSQFCCTKDDKWQLSLKANHAYYYQIQRQITITGKNLCDFVVMPAGQIHSYPEDTIQPDIPE